ncbi:hypothetical protein Tco_1118982 [Tanacetum coccineum]
MSNDPLSQEIGLGDRPRCQDTTLGDAIAQTRSERASKHSYDLPLPRGYTLGSDEGRPNLNELMAICTNLSNMVLALETSRTAQDLIGTSKRKSLDKENVSKQGRKSDKTKPMFDDSDFAELDVDNAMENVEVNTASIDVSAAGPSNVSTADPSTSTVGDIFEDDMMTIADTLMAIRSTRTRTTSVIIHDVEEELRRSTPAPTAQPSSKDKGKALMDELERMQRERVVQEEASDVALIVEFDDIQAMLEVDELLAARL